MPWEGTLLTLVEVSEQGGETGFALISIFLMMISFLLGSTESQTLAYKMLDWPFRKVHAHILLCFQTAIVSLTHLHYWLLSFHVE